MKTRTENILRILKVLAYLAMIGYIVKLGSQVISFAVYFFNPQSARNIYGSSLNLFELQKSSVPYFIFMMVLLIAVTSLHVSVWASVIRMLSKLNLQLPFTDNVAKLLEKTALLLLAIWMVDLFMVKSVEWISAKTALSIGSFDSSNEYLFFAGILYIISQIFRRGIELQQENQLTV